MTRDEAITKATELWDRNDVRSPSCIVDILSAFGVLKLDEPKSRDEKVQDAMKASLGIMATWQDLHRIDSAMADAGLKIVEK